MDFPDFEVFYLWKFAVGREIVSRETKNRVDSHKKKTAGISF